MSDVIIIVLGVYIVSLVVQKIFRAVNKPPPAPANPGMLERLGTEPVTHEYNWNPSPVTSAVDPPPGALSTPGSLGRLGAATPAPHYCKSHAPASPPTNSIARWKIKYRDIEGQITQRSIHLVAVRPRLERIEAWCELRQSERSFSLYGIREAVDLDTGEIIDLNDWIAAYNKSRRRKRA